MRYAEHAMSVSERTYVSEQEFMALPESTQRIELLDGDVIMPPSATVWHQGVLLELVIALKNWADLQKDVVTVAMSPLDVRFGTDRILQPDAMVFFAPIPADTKLPIRRIPELTVEVVSTNRTYDRVTKRYVYAEAGVQEYWLVDPARFVEVRRGSTLGDVTHHEDTLTSPLLPGFSLDLRALFAR